jgi:hypothetical protein
MVGTLDHWNSWGVLVTDGTDVWGHPTLVTWEVGTSITCLSKCPLATGPPTPEGWSTSGDTSGGRNWRGRCRRAVGRDGVHVLQGQDGALKQSMGSQEDPGLSPALLVQPR